MSTMTLKSTQETNLIDNYCESFSPVIGKNPKILILGTMPGRKSLEMQEYYYHPRNIFWRIIFNLLKTDEKNTYSEKIKLIKKNRIALWDVCYSCTREGSLDSNIKDETPNQILDFLQRHPSIETIIFNGQKAREKYLKYFDYIDGVEYFCLPSTSPANTSMNFQEKLVKWNLKSKKWRKLKNQ
jgi:hypoxanthine-DNA glycosylase